MRGISPVVFGGKGGGISPEMMDTLLVTLGAFLFLYVVLVNLRLKVDKKWFEVRIVVMIFIIDSLEHLFYSQFAFWIILFVYLFYINKKTNRKDWLVSAKAKIKIVVIVIILFFSFLTFKAVKSSLVYYLTVSEVKQKESFSEFKRLRVSGIVEKGSIKRNEDGSISFNITDQESAIYVKYKGLIPDIFQDEIQAVVEGTIQNDVFLANKLFAKCPTKYEDDKLGNNRLSFVQ